jgi:hypothetical protein
MRRLMPIAEKSVILIGLQKMKALTDGGLSDANVLGHVAS